MRRTVQANAEEVGAAVREGRVVKISRIPALIPAFEIERIIKMILGHGCPALNWPAMPVESGKGLHRGFCQMTFPSKTAAECAIYLLNGSYLARTNICAQIPQVSFTLFDPQLNEDRPDSIDVVSRAVRFRHMPHKAHFEDYRIYNGGTWVGEVKFSVFISQREPLHADGIFEIAALTPENAWIRRGLSPEGRYIPFSCHQCAEFGPSSVFLAGDEKKISEMIEITTAGVPRFMKQLPSIDLLSSLQQMESPGVESVVFPETGSGSGGRAPQWGPRWGLNPPTSRTRRPRQNQQDETTGLVTGPLDQVD
ncbi:hypothetical protein F4777DRAFT_575599 [Nemania sp. FL0916]|nr:hypothetical protein F4777DRAFT_575599 [Nemania sp. FL0916]